MTIKTPPRPRSTLLFVSVGIVLAIAVIYSAGWIYAAGQIRKGVVNWAQEQRAAGITVAHGKITAHGFPFLLRTRIEDVQIAMSSVYDWSVERLYVDALPYDLKRIILSPDGRQRLVVAGVPAPLDRWEGSADRFRISLADRSTRTQPEQWRIQFDLRTALFRTADGSERLSIEQVSADAAPDIDNSQRVTLGILANGLGLRRQNDRAGRLPLVEMSSDLFLPPGENTGETATTLLMVINHLVVEDQPAQLGVKGEITMDVSGSPSGTLETRLVKPANFISTARALGFVTEEQADAALGAVTVESLRQGGAILTSLRISQGVVSIGDGAAGEDVFDPK